MSTILSAKRFKKEVMETRNLSLVQFRTEWSGPCQIIAPVYEELAASYTGIVHFFSVDAEQDPALEQQFGIIQFPTILFFKNGELIDHLIGLAPKNILISKIENALIE